MADREPEGAALLTHIAIVENLTSHTFLLMGASNSVACS